MNKELTPAEFRIVYLQAVMEFISTRRWQIVCVRAVETWYRKEKGRKHAEHI